MQAKGSFKFCDITALISDYLAELKRRFPEHLLPIVLSSTELVLQFVCDIIFLRETFLFFFYKAADITDVTCIYTFSVKNHGFTRPKKSKKKKQTETEKLSALKKPAVHIEATYIGCPVGGISCFQCHLYGKLAPGRESRLFADSVKGKSKELETAF